MIRTLFAAAAIAVASWGMTTGTTAPIGRAEPADANCTEMSSNGICIYRNCTDAHRHGRYDIPLGDPEYCPAQDRDNDGVACES